MIQLLKHPILRNWHLKLFSLVLATVLWAAVASEPNSEIPIFVPIEYQNIPLQTEVVTDGLDRVEVRLRGPSSLVKELSNEISLTIDMAQMPIGQEKILPLTTEQIHAPISLEVVRVIPARVRFILERTVSKSVQLIPTFAGELRDGLEVERVVLKPDAVAVEGPESHVDNVKSVPTTPINLSGKRATFIQTVDLDILDPVVRIPKADPVQAEVRIRKGRD
jgi:YbbR domain-containing protein